MRGRSDSDREEKLWQGGDSAAISPRLRIKPGRMQQHSAKTTCDHPAPKFMYASADRRQTVPSRPNKKSFWQKRKKVQKQNN